MHKVFNFYSGFNKCIRELGSIEDVSCRPYLKLALAEEVCLLPIDMIVVLEFVVLK